MAKKKKSTITSAEEAERILGEIKTLTIQITTLEADTNAAMTRIETAATEKLTPLRQQLAAFELDLELYTLANRSLFEKVRMLSTIFGKYGLRKLPPSVKYEKKWKAGDVVAAILSRITYLCQFITPGQQYTDEAIAKLESENAMLEEFVRVTTTLDKEAILAAHRTGRITDAQLATLGLVIQKDAEEFAYSLDLIETSAS